MIRFSNQFPKYKYPTAFLKLLISYYKFFDHPVIDKKKPILFGLIGLTGRQSFLASLRDKHKGERCFIIANGPSLSKMDLKPLKNEVTFGCNGIYKKFNDFGFQLDYHFTEDTVQTELRAKEISDLKGSIKFAGIHNSYAFPFFNDINYFYTPIHSNMKYTEELYPQFSEDAAAIIYKGSTITYIMLQFAFHMGFSEVNLIGLDHDYGEIVKLFPPGTKGLINNKLLITEENYNLVSKCHFDKNYYKIGDYIGIPNVINQELAYAKAKQIFEKNSRQIYNLTPNTKLDVFPIKNIKDVL